MDGTNSVLKDCTIQAIKIWSLETGGLSGQVLLH